MAKLAGQVYRQVQGCSPQAHPRRPRRRWRPRPRDRARSCFAAGCDPRPPRALDVQVRGRRDPLSRATDPDALGEAGVGAVHVEEDDTPCRVVHDAVPRARRGGVERSGPGPHDVVAARRTRSRRRARRTRPPGRRGGAPRSRASPGSTSSRNTEISGRSPRIVITRSSRWKRSPPPGGMTSASAAGRPPSAGGACESKSLRARAGSRRSRSPGHGSSGSAASPGPSLSKPWTTPGGHDDERAGGRSRRGSSSGPSLEGHARPRARRTRRRGGGGRAARRRAPRPRGASR